MASACRACGINDAHMSFRPTYVGLYKWPESDTEFLRSISSKAHCGLHAHPRVVDSISCRQMYLRSYTFTRKESVSEKTKKYLDKIGEKIMNKRSTSRKRSKASSNNSTSNRRIIDKTKGLKKAKEAICATLLLMIGRLLSCTAKVDVVGYED